MKICIVSFGPVESKSNGYFIRVWNVANELSKHNEIVVLEFTQDYGKNRGKKQKEINFIQLRKNFFFSTVFSNIIKRIFTFNPFTTFEFQLLSLLELWKQRKLIQSADVVIIEGCLIPFGIFIAKLYGKKVILDTHCINTLLAQEYKRINRAIYFLRTILWSFLEMIAIKFSDIVITVAEYEKEFVIEKFKPLESKVFLVPNIIEKPKKVSKKTVKELRKKLKLLDKVAVTFVGDLSSVQNADAVEYIVNELAPYFLNARKDVVFLIVGGGRIYKHNLPNVIFTGFVKDLESYLAMSDIFIAPMRVGAGTMTKVLNYIVHEKPTIVTPIAIRGLEKISSSKMIKIAPIDNFKSVLLDTINKVKTTTPFQDHYSKELIYNLKKDFIYGLECLVKKVNQ
jgi:glycosyltransferase involved in cell wall biosynthesis